MKSYFSFPIVLLILFIGGIASKATPLNLAQQHPDVFSDFIGVNYDSAIDVFSATGFSESLNGTSFLGGAGAFSITAHIDGSGVLIAGVNTVEIYSPASTLLLSGNLTAFGFVPMTGGTLEFLFSVTGGSLSALFGNQGGIILSQTDFVGGFSSDFSTDVGMEMGLADTFSVPDQGGTVLLMCFGLVVFAVLRNVRSAFILS